MKLNEQLKNVLSLFLRIGLSAVLLVYLFRKIDTKSMLGLLKEADFQYIYFAAAMFMVINFILLLRWLGLMKALKLEVPIKSIVDYFFIGLFFNLFLPSSTGGDFVKTLGICKFTSQKAKVVASVVLDRLSGFIGIIIVAFLSFLFGYRFLNDLSLLVSIFALAFASGVMMMILFNEKLFSFGCRIFNKLPKIKKSLMDLHYDIVLLKDKPDAFLWAVGLSCLSQIILAFTFFLVAKALHQNIDMIYFLVFIPLVCVISSLPSIGGLGIRDMGAAHLFARVGVPSGVTVSITLINFFFMVAIGVIGGIIYVAQLSPRRVQYHPSPSGVRGK